MLLYDWKAICKASRGRTREILEIVTCMTRRNKGVILAKSKKDTIYKWYDKPFAGTSYLLNIEDLLKNRYRYKDRDIVVYIGLAAFRSYPDYIVTKDTTLDIKLSPLSETQIKNNPLLAINANNRIDFKYEKEYIKHDNK